MAKQLFQGLVQFTDDNGAPYAMGTVGMYVPGTLTTKTTWQDPAEATANPNPVVLDAAGRCPLWGVGIYRQILSDVNGVQIWDKLVEVWPDTQELIIPCTATGTNDVVLARQGALQDDNLTHATALGNYQSVAWVQPTTNTTAVTTLKYGAFGPFPMYKDGSAGPVVVAIGDLHVGDLFIANYDQALNAGGGGWHVGGPGLYSIVQNSLITNYQPQIDALAARVTALEALRNEFGSDPGGGTNGTAAWVIWHIPGGAKMMIYWSSAINIAPGTRNIPIRGPGFATSGWIGNVTIDNLVADPLIVIDSGTKAPNSFDVHNYSASNINCEFILIGGTS